MAFSLQHSFATTIDLAERYLNTRFFRMPELLSAFPAIYSFLVWAPNSIWEVKYLLHRLIQKNTFHGNSFCLVISYTLPNLKNDCVFRLYALTCTEELALEFLHMKFLLSQWVIEQGSAVDSGASIWKDLLMLRVDITHQSWALGAGCRKLLIYRVTSLWEPAQKCQFRSSGPIAELLS